MASTLVNVPCNVGLIKPSINQSFNSVRVEIKANPRRNLIVRARDTKNESIEKTGLSIEECEAAVVAGKAPEAPPVPPNAAAPAGTPSVLFQLSRCPRRNRKSPAMRASFQETSLSPANFVYPLFIHEGEEDTPVGAMPGCYRLGWRHGLVEELSDEPSKLQRGSDRGPCR